MDSWTGSTGSSPRFCFEWWTPEVTKMPRHNKSSKQWPKLQTSLEILGAFYVLPGWEHGTGTIWKWPKELAIVYRVSCCTQWVSKRWNVHEQKLIRQSGCQDSLPVWDPPPQMQSESVVIIWEEPTGVQHGRVTALTGVFEEKLVIRIFP